MITSQRFFMNLIYLNELLVLAIPPTVVDVLILNEYGFSKDRDKNRERNGTIKCPEDREKVSSQRQDDAIATEDSTHTACGLPIVATRRDMSQDQNGIMSLCRPSVPVWRNISTEHRAVWCVSVGGNAAACHHEPRDRSEIDSAHGISLGVFKHLAWRSDRTTTSNPRRYKGEDQINQLGALTGGLDEMASDEEMAPDARLASSPGRRCSVMLGSLQRWPVVVAAMFRPAKLNA
jgi:hypothetical protein